MFLQAYELIQQNGNRTGQLAIWVDFAENAAHDDDSVPDGRSTTDCTEEEGNLYGGGFTLARINILETGRRRFTC